MEYNGQEYDYVFDVDIEDGKPALKLPYNLSENPYDRATKFLGDNDLPISYLDSVANFITENTKGATIGQQSQAPSADPMGTESRYRPDEAPAKKNQLPLDAYVTLTQAKFEPIHKKILSLNKNLIESGNKHLAMNPAEENVLADLVQTLSQGKKPLSVSEAAIDLLLKIILEWPYSDRLAGLDLFRCIVPSPAVASINHTTHGTVVDIVLLSALQTEGAINDNSVMMALRAIANLFATKDGEAVAAAQTDRVVSALERIVGIEGNPIGAHNRNLQIALTSAAFNYAVFGYRNQSKGGAGVGADALVLVCNVLATVLRTQTDGEVLYRALMVLQVILASGKNYQQAAKDLGVDDAIREALQKAPEDRVKDAAKECIAYLR